ncbi:MAG: YraN family protein [Lachnospiraceae bacterium]|nr:YraN family protein [Lachnospiraceae bacterium]
MNKRQVGGEYETKAVLYLEQQGLKILERNFRCRMGEIDIVAKDGEFVVFTEVKWRKTSRSGSALQSVDWKKQRTICRTSDYYRMKNFLTENTPMRFDVVAIEGDELHWIKNAFAYIP